MGDDTPERFWVAWYKLARWLRRRRLQLQLHPLCRMCEAKGLIVAASVADHATPHKGDYQLFWFGELQSLCASCHSGSKQTLESRGYDTAIGLDGWPVDPNHPNNTAD
jgi:hypothetical protein